MCLKQESLKILLIVSLTNVHYANALPTSTQGNASSIVNSQQNSAHISWIKEMRVLRHLLKECETNSSNRSSANPTTTWQCLKMSSLYIIDDMTRRQVIPIWRGVRFIQLMDVNENQDATSWRLNQNDFWQRKDLQYLTWFDRMALSFTKMLNTHMLEINLKELSEAFIENMTRKDISRTTNSSDTVGTARHRRHRFNMMVTMMFGVTALGAVLVPMGFQMLSVVSGKALLLAKMALLLASINGLKRVANSGVHYGLYHVPGEHYPTYYDRGDIHHPRNVQNVAPLVQPIEKVVVVLAKL